MTATLAPVALDATDTDEMCSNCGTVKPLADFGPNEHKLNGRQSWCRECEREAERARYQRRRRAILSMRATAYGLPE